MFSPRVRTALTKKALVVLAQVNQRASRHALPGVTRTHNNFLSLLTKKEYLARHKFLGVYDFKYSFKKEAPAGKIKYRTLKPVQYRRALKGTRRSADAARRLPSRGTARGAYVRVSCSRGGARLRTLGRHPGLYQPACDKGRYLKAF